MKNFLCFSVTFCLWMTFCTDVKAIQRTDVLECGLADGSKFVLKSNYDWSLIPIPLPNGMRITKRNGWGAAYHSTKGSISSEFGYTRFDGLGYIEFINQCAYYGMKGKAVMMDFGYVNSNGEVLYFNRRATGDYALPYMSGKKFRSDGVKKKDVEWIDFVDLVFVVDSDDVLISEQPLVGEFFCRNVNDKLVVDAMFVAVYQSTSSDGGKTWAGPVITNNAKIFEINKTWHDQSFISKPIRFNGKAINDNDRNLFQKAAHPCN